MSSLALDLGSGPALLYGTPVSRTHRDEDDLVILAPCWASIEDFGNGDEFIFAAPSCFLVTLEVRRAMQEVIRTKGNRFRCLERILDAILTANALMYRHDVFLFSFKRVDLEAAERYLGHEHFDGLRMGWSERVVRQLRRLIEEPGTQGDAMRLIEIRDALDR